MEEVWNREMSKMKTFLIILLTISIVVTYHLQKEIFKIRLEDIIIYLDEDLGIRDPLVTCKFPMLHPFDHSILKYVSPPSPIRCVSRNAYLSYIDNEGIIKFNKSAWSEIGYSYEDLECSYVEILLGKNDFEVKYGDKSLLTGNEKPKTDFIFVECNSKFSGLQVYKNFHAHCQRSPSVRKFLNNDELSVAVIGLDSLSRLNFMRQLPKTYRYIKEVMNADILFGFNKVGENTLPNVIPMLTGKHDPDPPYHNFKGWPFIWKIFNKRGGATMHSEDYPEINMFDYHENGIYEQPTLHYMRIFWLAVRKTILYKTSSTYCLGSVPNNIIFYNYLKSFLRTYKDSPSFLFSLYNEVTHDFINTVGVVDDSLFNFLSSSFEEGLFNRTVVFILGDHGNRMDSIRRTEVGKTEDRMPLVSVVLPEWVKRTHPKWKRNLRLNTNRLVSTFDIYKTFVQIISTIQGEDDEEEKVRFANDEDSGIPEYFKNKKDNFGISLFEEIPRNRTCKDAGISDLFCTCSNPGEEYERNEMLGKEASEAIIHYFNKVIIKEFSHVCSHLSLAKVESALVKKRKGLPYSIEIRFEVAPGGGLFESLLKISGKKYEIMGDVLRINKYGNQAKCLPEQTLMEKPLLRGVCLCKS